MVAAQLLLAQRTLRRLGTDQLPSTNSAIIALAGAGKSQAYAMLTRLESACNTLERPPGPLPNEAQPDTIMVVLAAVRDFLLKHPGAAAERGSRHRYSDTFRRFVLGLLAPGGRAAGLTVEQAAESTGVPVGSPQGWLRRPQPGHGRGTAAVADAASAAAWRRPVWGWPGWASARAAPWGVRCAGAGLRDFICCASSTSS